MEETLFISDLHLSPLRPETVERFLQFLAVRVLGVSNLYILGDLFDVWIGDDDDTPPHPAIIAALRTVTNSGTKIFLQHGNRDFLLGHRFAQATGTQLIGDHATIDLYGVPTLLMHGDLLCSDDTAYLRFRSFARNKLFINIFLLRSLAARRRQAQTYRQRSNIATASKSTASMDVNQETVVDYMRRFNVRNLIHGHTHKPGLHQFLIDGNQCNRWVLAEWGLESASTLCVNQASSKYEQL